MQKGVNPRVLLSDLGVDYDQIPDYVDDVTIWKIIINMLAEPPRRNKLRHVNTLDDVVRLLKGLCGEISHLECLVKFYVLSRCSEYYSVNRRRCISFLWYPRLQITRWYLLQACDRFPKSSRSPSHVRYQLLQPGSQAFFQVC